THALQRLPDRRFRAAGERWPQTLLPQGEVQRRIAAEVARGLGLHLVAGLFDETARPAETELVEDRAPGAQLPERGPVHRQADHLAPRPLRIPHRPPLGEGGERETFAGQELPGAAGEPPVAALLIADDHALAQDVEPFDRTCIRIRHRLAIAEGYRPQPVNEELEIGLLHPAERGMFAKEAKGCLAVVRRFHLPTP